MFFAAIHCGGDSDNSLTTGYFDSSFVEGSSIWSQAFTYDQYGNLSKSGTISFQPTSFNSSNQPSTGTFDLIGNLTHDPVQSYAYDADSNAISIAGMGLTYDAFDRMVEQSGSGYQQIMYGPAGGKLALVSAQTLTKAFVPLPAGATAVYNSTGLIYYRRPDWLGSSRLASTYNQQVYYDGAYAPFGENYSEYAPGGYDRSFTGQNQDTISASAYPFYDFPRREYHPTRGRWLTPDPAGLGAADPTDPQSWNRYAYVTNNPLALTDPAGLGSGNGVDITQFCPHGNCQLPLGAPVGWDPFGLTGIRVVVIGTYMWNDPLGTSMWFQVPGKIVVSVYQAQQGYWTWSDSGTPIGDAFVIFGAQLSSSPFYFTPTQNAKESPSLPPLPKTTAFPYVTTLPGTRYCGPGGFIGEPLNGVDAACQKHDSCYADNRVSFVPGGHSAKTACDQQLCADLSRNIFYTSQESANQFFVQSYFGCK